MQRSLRIHSWFSSVMQMRLWITVANTQFVGSELPTNAEWKNADGDMHVWSTATKCRHWTWTLLAFWKKSVFLQQGKDCKHGVIADEVPPRHFIVIVMRGNFGSKIRICRATSAQEALCPKKRNLSMVQTLAVRSRMHLLAQHAFSVASADTTRLKKHRILFVGREKDRKLCPCCALLHHSSADTWKSQDQHLPHVPEVMLV